MKKTSLKKNFEIPKIFGALVSRGEKPQSSIKREFTKLGKKYAYLTFATEKKYLHNITLCMRLMDIDGLSVSRFFARSIVKYVKLRPSAQMSGMADVIVKSKGGFVGMSVETESLIHILNSLNLPSNFRTAHVSGLIAQKKLAEAALKIAGYKIAKPEKASITILANASFSVRSCGKTILSSKQFSELSSKLAVELLTHPV